MIQQIPKQGLLPILMTLATGSLLMAACMAEAHGGSGEATSPAAASQRGGADLWGANCARCHHMRSPSEFSDAEWEVVMLHMRVRANLTGEETRKILEFLKAGN